MAEKTLMERHKDEVLVFAWATNKACQTCRFAHGEIRWNGKPNKLYPNKCYCLVYIPENSNGKPEAVAFDGAPCEYYEKDDEAREE